MLLQVGVSALCVTAFFVSIPIKTRRTALFLAYLAAGAGLVGTMLIVVSVLLDIEAVRLADAFGYAAKWAFVPTIPAIVLACIIRRGCRELT